MKLIIHRGTKEIGGSCVELCSGKTRIIIDLGMPLVNTQGEPFNSKEIENKTVPELIANHILPDIRGIYIGEEKGIDAILISHPHQDHYGLLRYINPEIPVYMSEGTLALIRASDIFIPTKANLHKAVSFKMWEKFKIVDLIITPQLVDHSAFDAAAFLIEGEGKKILYSGDYRGHGRKKVLFDNFIDKPISNVDYLLLEGSMLGRAVGLYPSEQSVEIKMTSIFRNKSNMAFVFCSSQNIDRIVSVYRAAKKAGQITVIDLYTAFILNSIKNKSNKLPQYSWTDVRVLYLASHAKTLADNGLKSFLYDCVKAKIKKKDLCLYKNKVVIITRDNYDFKKILREIDDLNGVKAIYSMWEGYLENSDLRDRLGQKGIELEIVHTSGHAPESDLKRFVVACKPKCIIPIHTFYPQAYQTLFPDTIVHTLNDAEELIF